MRARQIASVVFFLIGAISPTAWAISDFDRWVADLEGADPAKQVLAARLLGKSGKKAAVDPLLRMFDVRRASPRLTTAVVISLGELKDPRALDALMGAWDYLNSARLQLGQELPANLQMLRATIVQADGLIGTERAYAMLEQAINDRDPVVVQKAAWALGYARDKRGVDALISLLTRGGQLSLTAFEALAEMDDPRGNSRIHAYLKSEDLPTRLAAAHALAKAEGGKNSEPLFEILADDKLEAGNRMLAAYYLAKLNEKAGLDFLARVVQREPPNAKAQAVQYLGRSGNAKAVAVLVEAGETSDPQLRMLVVRALGQLGGAKAVDALRRMSEDRNPTIKAAARQALAELGKEL